MASKPSKRVGNDCDEGPPVAIPNTEVKLICADNTCRVTCREDRYCQHKHSSLAQSVEQRTVNPAVVGSSPTGGAKRALALQVLFFCITSFTFPDLLFIRNIALQKEVFYDEGQHEDEG